jgi:hypothetical protein
MTKKPRTTKPSFPSTEKDFDPGYARACKVVASRTRLNGLIRRARGITDDALAARVLTLLLLALGEQDKKGGINLCDALENALDVADLCEFRSDSLHLGKYLLAAKRTNRLYRDCITKKGGKAK